LNVSDQDMDALTFIVEIVKAAAWPLATLFIALQFRTELRALLARMKKGKVGPAEFEFEETVKMLKAEAAELPPPETASIGTPVVTLVTSEPRAAIFNAWLEVETALSHLAQSKGQLAPHLSRSPVQAIRALQKAELIEPNYVALFNDLRGLRNQAAHELEFNPSTESVLSYVQLAKELAGVLQKSSENR
jgi:hypothetical protein